MLTLTQQSQHAVQAAASLVWQHIDFHFLETLAIVCVDHAANSPKWQTTLSTYNNMDAQLAFFIISAVKEWEVSDTNACLL